MTNQAAGGFLSRYRSGTKDKTLYLPLERGFLRLRYGLNDGPADLSIVSFVLEESETAPAIGPRLELRFIGEPGRERVTFITENGVSGRQWSNGRAYWGNTFDDAAQPDRQRWIGLEEWVDECIEDMVNPTDDYTAGAGTPHC